MKKMSYHGVAIKGINPTKGLSYSPTQKLASKNLKAPLRGPAKARG